MGHITDDLEPSEVLDELGWDYKETSGSSGEQLNVKECPTCGNSKWKTYLNAETGFGACFVCDQTFNKWTFVAAALGGVDKKTVGKFFHGMNKVSVFRPKETKQMAVHTEVESARLPLSMALPTSAGRNDPYLEDRGITSPYAKRFNLRICKYGYHSYERDGTKMTQKFDDRIIIPVLDLNGDLVSFQGRDITGKSDRKYLFPAQLPATGRYIYNGHEAMALRASEVIMNEGAFDVIPVAICCDLFPEMRSIVPVGSFGKHLSSGSADKPGQLDALSHMKRNGSLKVVTIMWDGEPAALLSALGAAALITGLGLRARIALLPAGKDPNEVDAVVIRDAWLEAKTYTRLLDIRWRARNPYRPD
jgi:DNA primase